MLKTINKRIISLLLILLMGFLTIHFYVPRFITEVNNPVLHLIRGAYQADESFGDDPDFKGKYITVNTNDYHKITAYITYSQQDYAKGTVILLHGIRSRKEHFIPVTKLLAEHGYNSVAVDLRAHGNSSGKYCTFGVKEKLDIKSLVDHLIENENVNNNIGVWGQSLGAAVALQTMAIDDRIKFGIIESTFSDFRTTAHDYFRFHLGFEIPFFTDYLIDRAGQISDFNPDDAVPWKACTEIHQSVLVVHGDKDQRIKIKYGRKNFEQISSEDKEFLAIENAAHLNVWKVGGDHYFQKVLTFIEDHNKPK